MPARTTGSSEKLIDSASGFDVIGITGQALSHCVAWTIDDLLKDILQKDPEAAARCTSSETALHLW